MKKRSGKKGMELSLNTIIIAVIVIIVLVAVVSFFLFGFKGLTDKAKEVFFGTTAGYNMAFAQQTCANYCDQAGAMQENSRIKSAYCVVPLKVDMNNDGQADTYDTAGTKDFIKFYCPKGTNAFSDGLGYLGIDCNVKVGNENLDAFSDCINQQ